MFKIFFIRCFERVPFFQILMAFNSVLRAVSLGRLGAEVAPPTVEALRAQRAPTKKAAREADIALAGLLAGEALDRDTLLSEMIEGDVGEPRADEDLLTRLFVLLGPGRFASEVKAVIAARRARASLTRVSPETVREDVGVTSPGPRQAAQQEPPPPQAAQQEVQRRPRPKRDKAIVLCPSCGATPGLCDCARVAARKAQESETESDSDSEETTEDEDEFSDEDSAEDLLSTASSDEVLPRKPAAKQGSKTKLTPNSVLNHKLWPELARSFGDLELRAAIRDAYRVPAEKFPKDTAPFFDMLVCFARVLRSAPVVPDGAVDGVKRAISRLEFFRAKADPDADPDAVEPHLLEDELPPNIRKSRAESRRSKREKDKGRSKPAAAPRQASGRGRGESKGKGGRGRGRGGKSEEETG
jgi:hypothetical protein